ncbi:MAG: Hsp70 family protein [Nostoc sp. DedSLP03]|uniref:Hsp70 family protein n=1 Tax=Nostoc sp. DedSLP03 TaxID=3075400 RepID=UPI002AD35E05|nr:Hsp70 family protein [Nostoc sp. DedSLP03]MDZ7966419.1 Hsp70 family protein [Nostoc sp. DedSLP03]
MAINEKNIRVVLAIDFGTSRSGYAYAFVNDPRIIGRTEWEGQPIAYNKTLTHLLYSRDEGKNIVDAWGWPAKKRLFDIQRSFDDPQGYYFFENFKMKLHQGQDKNSNAPDITTNDGQTFAVLDLISDYVKLLKELALEEIKNSTAGYLKDSEILWCLTIPAIWTNAEKQFMRKAAQKAGLVGEGSAEAERLLLVLEPEAAAIYCQDKEKSQLEPETRFMVVDCGGGTVDITVHEVLQDRKLKEVVIGKGGKYGSTYIDKDFEKYLRKKLNADVIDRYESDYPQEYLEMMANWERIKCDFNPQNNDNIINFSIPRKLDRLLQEHYPHLLEHLAKEQQGEDANIYLDKKTMMDIFSPTLNGLIETVDEQFHTLNSRGCDIIFLVGGFSSSPILRQQIQQKFGSRVKKIVFSPSPGAAIVEGAVLYGLNPSIIPLRRSRLTYGCETSLPFDSTLDPETKKFWSSYRKGYYCKQRFDIFVKAGEPVEVNKGIEYDGYSPQQEDQKEIKFPFYSTEKQQVRYTDDPGVDKIGELIVEIPKTEINSKHNIKVIMYFGDTEIKVEAINPESGRKYNIKFLFDYL